jgi:hypothetical protein
MEELGTSVRELQQDIADIREYFPKLVAQDRQRIKVLEEKADATDPKTVKHHLDGLHDHMKAVGLKQVTFKDAARILQISKQRLHQLKAVIALDQRFVIVKSQSHKQKELIRLR